MILLMVQKSHSQPPGMDGAKIRRKSWGFSLPVPQLVSLLDFERSSNFVSITIHIQYHPRLHGQSRTAPPPPGVEWDGAGLTWGPSRWSPANLKAVVLTESAFGAGPGNHQHISGT